MEKTLFEIIPEVVNKAPNFGYYNTTALRGPELAEVQQKTKSQTEAVLAFFQRHEGVTFSAWETWKYMKLKNVPITSIRRAITDLVDAGNLVETGNLRIGNYGRKCKVWRLK